MARHVVRSALYNKLRWLTLPRNPLAFEGFYMREWFDQICILEKKLPDDFMENKLEGENGNKERQCEAVAITPVKNAESLKPD